jgi:HD-like signal output (HDOD) protein
VALITVNALAEGMVLANDLHAPNGRMILARGAVVRNTHVRMLKVWGVSEVDVEKGGEEITLPEEFSLNEEALRRRSDEIVDSYFPPSAYGDDCMRELRRLCALRTARKLKEGISLPELPERGDRPPQMPLRDGLPLEPISPYTLVRNEVRLVSYPDIYFKIKEVLESPVSSAAHIGEVVSKDPSLSARLLRLVNSSFYGFPTPIESIPRAIAIIGVNELTTLALAVSTINFFRHVPERYVDMRSFWEHSLACGVFSRILAYAKRKPSEERYFLAGLLHDIGRLVLYRKMPELMTFALRLAVYARIPLFRIEKRLFGFDHAHLGQLLLREWRIPETIGYLVGGHHDPFACEHPEDAAVIHAADVFALALRMGTSGSWFVPMLEKEAWKTLELSPASLESLLVQGERQMQETMNIFFPQREAGA